MSACADFCYVAGSSSEVHEGRTATSGKELRKTTLGTRCQRKVLDFSGLACSAKRRGGRTAEEVRHDFGKALIVRSPFNTVAYRIGLSLTWMPPCQLRRFSKAVQTNTEISSKSPYKRAAASLLGVARQGG